MFAEADSTFLAVEIFEGNKANGLAMSIYLKNEGEKTSTERYVKENQQEAGNVYWQN